MPESKDEIDVSVTQTTWICGSCGCENNSARRVCVSCGKPRYMLSSEFGKKSVHAFMALYFTLLAAIIFIWFAEPGGNGWKGVFWGNVIMGVITLFFVAIDFSDFRRYVFPSRVRWRIVLYIAFFTPLFSLVVSNLTNWVNLRLFSVDYGTLDKVFDAPSPVLYGMLFCAVLPALFEEFAFRGVIFGRGKGVFSLKQTIWASSILFTLLHISVISFAWVFPFAMMLGYLRARYRTVFYGVCLHFLHNFTAVMADYYGWNNIFAHFMGL